MLTPRLPNPSGSVWTRWGESLIRVLQPVLETIQNRLVRVEEKFPLAAADVTFTPAGNVAATNVQAAIQELDTEKVAKAGDTMTGALSLPAGTAALPSLTFAADPDTGIWNGGVDNFQIVTGGVARIAISTGTITATLVIRGADGGVTAPGYSFASDTNTGMWRASEDNLCFSAGGVERLRISGTSITAALPIALPADPTLALQAAPKQYVDVRCPVTLTLGADFVSSSVTLASVTGMVQAVGTNQVWRVEVYGKYQTAATTTGAGISLLLPASATVSGCAALRQDVNGVDSFYEAQISVSDENYASASVIAATTDYVCLLTAIVTTAGTAGNITLRWRSEVGGSNATLRAGTVMSCTRLV